MSLFKKLLGRTEEPKPRTRVCVECGMPIDRHMQWCAIWQTQQAMEQKKSGVPDVG